MNGQKEEKKIKTGAVIKNNAFLLSLACKHAPLHSADLHLADVHVAGGFALAHAVDEPQFQQAALVRRDLAEDPLQPFPLLHLLITFLSHTQAGFQIPFVIVRNRFAQRGYIRGLPLIQPAQQLIVGDVHFVRHLAQGRLPLQPLRQALGLDEHSRVLLISTEGDTDRENYQKILAETEV